MHDVLIQIDTTKCHKTHLLLPGNLCDDMPRMIISKELELNPKLEERDWSSVTSDDSETTLSPTTFNTTGLSLLTELKILNTGDN